MRLEWVGLHVGHVDPGTALQVGNGEYAKSHVKPTSTSLAGQPGAFYQLTAVWSTSTNMQNRAGWGRNIGGTHASRYLAVHFPGIRCPRYH
jgi:hypothetical protein